jgi:kinesin family protein 5
MYDDRASSRTSFMSDQGGSTPNNNNNNNNANNIKVIARFRPSNDQENSDPNASNIVQFLSDSVCKIDSKDFSGTFAFDRVFDMDCRQEDIFEYSLRPTVEDLIKGYNGTVLAYGQTGSGKSYTMMGPSIDDVVDRGVVPRMVDYIFELIHKSPPDIEYMVRVSYMEIYMEKIRDLLNPSNDNLQIHEDKSRGIYVKGLTEEYVVSANEVFQVMRQGSRIRAVGATNMNQESSRSHSMFMIVVSQKNSITGSQKSGQMSLIDLAGSEKVGKTGASGQTLEEAKKINKSLSVLGMVINALTDGKSTHIPYRDSKLTRILQESLGGNSRTSLIVNCSPSSYNDTETLSTLRFGVRAKTIKNKAKINAELSPGELRQLLRQSQTRLELRITYDRRLEAELMQWRSGNPPAKSEWMDLTAVVGPPPSSPRSTSSMSTRSSTPNRRLATNRWSDLPLSPCLTEDTVDELIQKEMSLRDQLAEKESLIERQELVISELKNEDPQELRLEIDNLLYDKKELGISLSTLRAENAQLSMALDTAKKELLDLNLAVSTTPATSPSLSAVSDDYGIKKQRKLAEMLGPMYLTHSRKRSVDQAIDLVDGLTLEDDDRTTKLKTILEGLAYDETYFQNLLQQQQDRYDELLVDDSLDASSSQIQAQNETIAKLMVELDKVNKENAIIKSQGTASEQLQSMQSHIAQFEEMKSSLMRDLQDRCERIVELEISLDQVRDQYNLALRNTNNKHQQKKMALLQRNLEQLSQVQKQLMEQNAELKKEVAIDEKLLTSRNERIQILEDSLRKSQQVAAEDREKFTNNLALLRNHLAEVRVGGSGPPGNPGLNIIKPLRGGGDKKEGGIWNRISQYANS